MARRLQDNLVQLILDMEESTLDRRELFEAFHVRVDGILVSFMQMVEARVGGIALLRAMR